MLLALASAGLLLASAGLMLVDPRQVMGASTWLKPAKFGMSVALTSVTLAVLLRQLAPLGRVGPLGGGPERPRCWRWSW